MTVPPPPPRSALRCLDANANRAAEGLRVLEDAARFLLDDTATSLLAKELRHRLRAAIPVAAAAGDRDTAGDVGTAITVDGEMRRADLTGVLRANARRVQEALRSAEEFAKLVAPAAAVACEQVRYASYQLELRLLSRLPAWRLWQVRLYALIDTALAERPLDIAAAVIRGGAGAVQLRAKGLGERAYRELADGMAAVCRRDGALFVVNDHAAVARIVGADALHLGQDDLAVADARLVVPASCALGVSAHTLDQVTAAIAAGADYLGLGPMYATATKPHEPARGPELLDQARPLLDRPSYAIGGLDRARVAALLPRLPHGVAVAGALCRAADPERAAAAIRDLLESDDRLLAGGAAG